MNVVETHTTLIWRVRDAEGYRDGADGAERVGGARLILRGGFLKPVFKGPKYIVKLINQKVT